MAEKSEITTITDDMIFKGSLEADHTIVIEGHFAGSLTTKGKAHIAKEAKIEANVTARELALEGQMQGNVLQADLVSLSTQAKLNGDIHCTQLEIERGAKHSGVTVMQ